MTFDLKAWASFAVKQHEFSVDQKFHHEAQITHRVSKQFKGAHKQDYGTTLCKSPETCGHLHFDGRFECKTWASGRCDSDLSRKVITGDLASSFGVTLGHCDGSSDPKDKIHERGYFFGGIKLENRGGTVLDGVFDGNCNLGIVRDPLKNPAEDCKNPGRWYGRIQSGVYHRKELIGFLTANVAMDVELALFPGHLEYEYVATVEGMLIQDCKEAA